MNLGAIFTTPGIGGIIAITIFSAAAAIYGGLTYWILRGGKPEQER